MIVLSYIGLLALIPLVLILGYIAYHGFSAISWDFLTRLPKPVGEKGGQGEVVPGHWLGTIETFPSHFVHPLAGQGKRGLCRVVQQRLCRSMRSHSPRAASGFVACWATACSPVKVISMRPSAAIFNRRSALIS